MTTKWPKTSTGTEAAKSINDLLDLEADRAMEIIRNIVAVKPMDEDDINNPGVNALQRLCEDLVPTEGLESEEDAVLEGYMAPLQPAATQNTDTELIDTEVSLGKPKRTWKRKVYPISAVCRSARARKKKKFHDEI